MAMFCYLPATMQERYLQNLPEIIPTILKVLSLSLSLSYANFTHSHSLTVSYSQFAYTCSFTHNLSYVYIFHIRQPLEVRM